jgi:hypothetical protein
VDEIDRRIDTAHRDAQRFRLEEVPADHLDGARGPRGERLRPARQAAQAVFGGEQREQPAADIPGRAGQQDALGARGGIRRTSAQRRPSTLSTPSFMA